MYPIMRKNVIRRWTTLSLIDKGESSAEMIQMAHMQSSAAAGKGEKKTKKKNSFSDLLSTALREQNTTSAITYIYHR